MVFNIASNKYRLIVEIQYRAGIAYKICRNAYPLQAD
ncbi:type II toxin-antitoxin system HigB family toxin [Methylomonas methanica]|nr:type II toxin-antitoxin system HigB family toxin [Methylomonas methanica]